MAPISSLDMLRKLAIPGVPDVGVSPGVMEAAPDLSLDTPHTLNEALGNERLKALFGLDQRSDAFKQQQTDLDAQDKAVNEARIAANPEVSAEADKAYKEKLQLAGEPARIAGQSALDVENAKNQGAIDLKNVEHQNVLDFLNPSGGPGGAANTGGGDQAPFKMSINAAGEPTFAANPMPALVQRAHDQLSDARNKTSQALADVEKQYPGITAAARQADSATGSPGWLSFLTGGAGKYGGLTDLVGARNERLKYSMGIPTPFAKLAQEASFGNIEQMAGQLPGVRGLATITPLFKEHQARWGYETPLATVQRLLHMNDIMSDSLTNMEHGGGTSANADPYADPNYQPK